MCVFEISQPNQTDRINLAHFRLNKKTLKIIQNIVCFCVLYSVTTRTDATQTKMRQILKLANPKSRSQQ